MKIKYFLLLLISLFLAGCGQKHVRDIDKAREKGILLVGIGPDPEGLDPHCVNGVTAQNVLRSLFEGLVKPHEETLEASPGVAETWTISEDGLKYSFNLRKNARWSNGDPLNAHDFVFSFQRLLTPALGAPGATSFFVIKNAEAFYSGKVDFSEVGIKAENDFTLTFTLHQPSPYFLSLLMQTGAYPVHRATLEKFNGTFSRDPLWTRSDNFVSNGAFKLKQWKIGESVEVIKNEHYWNHANVHLNGICFRPISDVATEERAFRRGQLHITENVPYIKIKEYYEKQPDLLRIHPYLGTFYYIFNTHVKPLDDVRVRKALNLALNRKSLVGLDLFQIKHRSTFQLVPEGCQAFRCINPVVENAERARHLLAEAGYPNGKNFPRLTLTFNTAEGQIFLATAIQEMWKKELNIDIELINIEWKVYLQKRREKDYQIARGGWIGDYNDPTTFLNLWTKNNPNNFTYWTNERYNQLLELAAKETSSERRIHYLEEAEAIILEELPLLPIHSSATSHLIDSSVKNWYPNLLDWHPYDCIFLDKIPLN